MGLLVISPGHFTTVQDQGRAGHRGWGVPVAGAFDRVALDLANGLLGNSPNCAALEMTLHGGIYEAQSHLAIALAGAAMDTSLVLGNRIERRLSLPLCCSMAPGDRLRLGGSSTGARTYLAVRGGWRTRMVLGSRSEEKRLSSGVVLPVEGSHSTTPTRRPILPSWSLLRGEPIRVIAGPDAGRNGELDCWLGSTFRVAHQSDRMGLRLEGKPCEVRVAPETLSKPVAPGTIQVAGGQMLILGVACGTMGGYPQVAHVISADLSRIGQIREGDQVSFERVTINRTRCLDGERRAELASLVRRLTVLASDSAWFVGAS